MTFRELRDINMSLHTARVRIKAKAGYYKIMKCCAQALADGLHWVWVDTCCINKESSAELSEAINSMFAWYKNAEVCYAYLDDIDMFDPYRQGDLNFTLQDSTTFWTQSIDLLSEKDLSKARWFTRGWTLQELIAPKNMVFYIKGWNYVGNKISMRRKLSNITGIDEHTLMTGNVEAVSVARRMSWAAKRATTRIEDMAYCLLGIFDVNMPLLYGEREKAFTRLQEEIMKDSEDMSLFAWRPSGATEVWDLDLVLPMSPEDGRSIFAQHPSEFWTSSMVRPSSCRGAHYTLTNKGVMIEIPVLPLDHGLYLIILECHYHGDLSQQLGIVVQNMHGGSPNQFVRHDAVGLIKVRQELVQKAELTTIYLCKKFSNSRDLSSVYKIFSNPDASLTEEFEYEGVSTEPIEKPSTILQSLTHRNAQLQKLSYDLDR
jgi:hypothetical protein